MTRVNALPMDVGEPSAREAARKVLGVARALAAIERVKVVHRDVKEANILVRDSNGEMVRHVPLPRARRNYG